MNNVTETECNTMSDSQILFKSMPEGELEKWITQKNIKLKRHGKLLTNEKETKLFLGILFSVTQAPKKGGIVRAFDVCSDGLFPAPDLGNLD